MRMLQRAQSDPIDPIQGGSLGRCRRWVWLSLLLASAVGTAYYFWSKFPPLSPVEHRLVGRWMLPEPDPRSPSWSGQITKWSGRITNPWLIREFRRDRNYRVWVVSADNPSNSVLLIEGRWRIVDGKLVTEDFEGSARLMRNIVARMKTWVLVLSPGRISGNTAVAIDLPDESTLEITNPWGEKFVWKRVRE